MAIAKPGASQTKSPDRLRAAALIALPVGAVGAAGLTLRAGARNPSLILKLLFLGWVLSPFVGLAWSWVASKRWGRYTQTALYIVMLVIVTASLGIYGYVVWGPPIAKPASVFLLLPPASWVLLACALLNAKR